MYTSFLSVYNNEPSMVLRTSGCENVLTVE